MGLAGFTTRALADRLGTYPATLYWHVGNRSQVLAAIVEHVLGEMTVEDPRSAGWKEWLRHASGEYRRVVHAHPHLAPVLVSQLVVNAPATRLVETVLAVLDGAGFRGQDLASAFNAYVGSLVGWVSVELAASPPDIGEDWQEAFASTVLGLPARNSPSSPPTGSTWPTRCSPCAGTAAPSGRSMPPSRPPSRCGSTAWLPGWSGARLDGGPPAGALLYNVQDGGRGVP